MDISPILFFLFSGIAVVSSLFVVLRKNPVDSALSLVLTFFSFAAIYALLQAHLIAALQILVYTGAIMVLFVFVIMLLNEGTPSLDMRRTSGLMKSIAAVFSLGFICLFSQVFKAAGLKISESGPHTVEAIQKVGGNTSAIAQLMFSDYIFPFELTSVLLLAAIVGTVAIAMRKKKGGKYAVR